MIFGLVPKKWIVFYAFPTHWDLPFLVDSRLKLVLLFEVIFDDKLYTYLQWFLFSSLVNSLV